MSAISGTRPMNDFELLVTRYALGGDKSCNAPKDRRQGRIVRGTGWFSNSRVAIR